MLHGQIRPPNLPQIARQQGQSIEQHLDAAAHAVAVATPSSDADLPIKDGNPRGLGHEPLEVKGIGRFCQVRLEHRHWHRFFLHRRSGNARGDHDGIQGLRLWNQRHAPTERFNPLARQRHGLVTDKAERGPALRRTGQRKTWIFQAAIEIRGQNFQRLALLTSQLNCDPWQRQFRFAGPVKGHPLNDVLGQAR